MSIYISDAIVAGDTSVSAAAGAGALAFSAQDPLASVGVSTASSSGLLSFSGSAADTGAGVSALADVGAFAFSGLSSDASIGNSPEAGAGSLGLLGLQAFAVARGRVVVVSSGMVLKTNPPTPISCLSGVMNQESTAHGVAVEETTLTGYYQINYEDCN